MAAPAPSVDRAGGAADPRSPDLALPARPRRRIRRIVIARDRRRPTSTTCSLGFAERWPWDLELNAHIFQFMADAGVAAVLVDVYHFDRGSGPDDHRLRRSPRETDIVRQQLTFEAETGRGLRRRAAGGRERRPGVRALRRSPSYQIEARVSPARGAPRARAGCVGGPRRPRCAPGPTCPSWPCWREREAPRVRQRQGGRRRHRPARPVVGRWGELRVLSLPVAGLLLDHRRDRRASRTARPPRRGAVQQPLNRRTARSS